MTAYNNGKALAALVGKATGSSTTGVAGILGYVGLAVDKLTASITDCVNNGNIKNVSTSEKSSFAGGIVAVKTDVARLKLVACENNGELRWLRNPNLPNVKQVKVVTNTGVASN